VNCVFSFAWNSQLKCLTRHPLATPTRSHPGRNNNRYDMVSAMKLVLFFSLALAVYAQPAAPTPQIGLPANQQGGKIKIIPPPGIAVPDADQRALRASLARIGARLDALKGNPRLPDIRI